MPNGKTPKPKSKTSHKPKTTPKADEDHAEDVRRLLEEIYSAGELLGKTEQILANPKWQGPALSVKELGEYEDLRNFRESSAIAEDSHVCLLVYRPVHGEESEDAGQYNRNHLAHHAAVRAALYPRYGPTTPPGQQHYHPLFARRNMNL